MSDPHHVQLRLNGEDRQVSIPDAALLVEVLRDTLDCPGTRIGCLTGDCGACSVLVDGQIAKSCLLLGVACTDRDIRTIEGLHSPLMTRIQAEFVRHKGFQCGFCTTGMVVLAYDLLTANPAASRDDIRHAVSGNLCRCTGYEAIVDAIEAARGSESNIRP